MIRRLMVSVVLSLAVLAIGSARVQTQTPPGSSYLNVIHLDVDQGEATLIVTPQEKRILIDAGSNNWTAAFLRVMNIDTVDLVVATHNHEDHIGGMPDVLESVVVRAYVDNGLPIPTRIYRRTVRAIESERGIQYLVSSSGRKNSNGDPSPSIISAWTAARAKVYRTDRHGTIFVRASRNGKYTVSTLGEAATAQR